MYGWWQQKLKCNLSEVNVQCAHEMVMAGCTSTSNCLHVQEDVCGPKSIAAYLTVNLGALACFHK